MYKRNQVEEAIGKVLQPGSEKISSILRSRIRRLLETDRRLKHSRRSTNPERANLAFFSKAMPGRGGENRFSEYEAFSLLLALRLMQDRFPQGFVVPLLRRIRPELEKEHARILKQNSALIFDQETIRQRATPGDMALETTSPVFLSFLSAHKDHHHSSSPVAVCRSLEDAIRFVRSQGLGRTVTSFELATSAHHLSAALANTEPSRRGRSGA
jgi:hypothetical protein